MPTRESTARWEGSLSRGEGTMKLGRGVWEGSYNVPSRFEDGEGSNPEELIAAAHAGCYSMALSAALSRAGHDVGSIDTTAAVTVEKVGEGFEITGVHLTSKADVDGVDEEAFAEFAMDAKRNCPVSKALAGTEITLDASLAT